jgi:glycosyltransferase involved in cell wall biosynthesis
MRIGVNCYPLQAHIGGIKQYFLSLFRYLSENNGGNDFVFFYFPQNVAELSKIIPLENKNAILLKSQSDIRKHLATIDVYFCPFGSLSPRPLPLPTVVTLVDIQEVYHPEFFSLYGLLARAYHYRGSTKMADRVITISHFSRKSIVEHHGISNEKVIVAHLCADERFYRAPQIARPPAQPLPQKYIFYPANYWQHKNHDLLLRAIQWIRVEKHIDIHLVLTGFPQKNGYPLAEKIGEYELSNQVHQLGYIPVEELAYLYLHAQLMVFPSLFEGFGIPLVEAMAAGCPVLAANTTSLPEIGQGCVCYFDPCSVEDLGQNILKLYDDNELRNDLIVCGRKRVQEFSAARMAEVHLRVFDEACQVYSFSRYMWLRWFYKYFHLTRMSIKFFLDLARGQR